MPRVVQLDFTTGAPSGSAVDLKGLRRIFPGPVAALDGIDLQIAPGEFVAILGPSGCGKSTLLRIVAGLDQADAGVVQVGREENDQRRIGYVFQDAYLLPWRSALRNVALPLELMRAATAQRLAAASSTIARVGFVSIFPVIANTLMGVSTDLALRDLFRLYNANLLATLFK